MNLRKVTIWTTGVMSLIVIGFFSVWMIIEILSKMQWIGFAAVFGCAFYSCPFVVSWCIARCLKYTVPSAFLFFSTVVCFLLCTLVMYHWFAFPMERGIGFFVSVVFLFIHLAFAWILVALLEICLRAFLPGTAATSSSPEPYSPTEGDQNV
jgi:hypothetical protein